MRKSLLKTPPSGLSSRRGAASRAALAAVGAARRPQQRNGRTALHRRATRIRIAVDGGQRRRAGDWRRAVRLLEGFVSRTEIADCAQHRAAVAERRPRRPRNRSAWSGRRRRAVAVRRSARTGFAHRRRDVRSPSRSRTGTIRSSPRCTTASRSSFPRRIPPPIARRRPSTPFEDAAFHVVPLGVVRLQRRARSACCSSAAARRRSTELQLVHRRSSARSWIRFSASRRSPKAIASRGASGRCSTASSTPSPTRFC